MTYTLEFTGERYLPWLVEDDPFIGYEHVHRYLLASNYVANKRVLDITCGEGYGTAMLARTARCVIGVDIDANTLRHAKQQHGKENILYVQADAQQFHLQKHSIDAVVSFETIEHFSGHEKFLNEISHSLTGDGLLFISTPNRAMYTDEDQQDNPFHKRELYRDEFVRLLRQHFRYVRLFGQSIMANSIIAETTGEYILRKRKNCRIQLTAIDNGMTEYPLKVESNVRPRYYVAICSNKELGTLPDELMVDDHATLTRTFVDHHRRWSTLNGENASLSARVSELDGAVSQRDARISQLDAQAQQLTDQLQHKERETHMAVEQMQHHEEALIEQMQQVRINMIDEMHSAQQMLAQRMELLLEREVAEREAFLAVQQQLLQRDEEISRLRESNEQLRNTFAVRDREFRHVEAIYKELEQHAQGQARHIEGLEAAHAEQQRIIAEQARIKAARVPEDGRYEEALSHYRNALQEIAQQRTLIAERDEHIDELTLAIEVKNQRLSELEGQGMCRSVPLLGILRRKLAALISA